MKKTELPMVRPLALGVWLAYAGSAFAQIATGTLPSAPSVLNGTVSMTNPSATALQITNTPGAIINWGSFSIGSSARVSFDQSGGAASAVLNRVTGADPSQILGRLESNGRIFLVNPNGILFGAGSVVDAQGLIASTRGITNGDFLAGNYLFQGASTGQVVVENTAQITTAARGPNGQVWLFADKVAFQAGSTVSAPDGQVVLAAGSQLQVGSGSLGNMVFTVTTGSDSTIASYGNITAERGAVGLFADSIVHGGRIATGGGSGEVLLMAARNIAVDDGAAIDASSTGAESGGRIALNAGNRLKIGALASVAADGGPLGGNGGQIDLVAYDLQVSPVTSGMGNVHASGRAAGALNGEVRVMPRAVPLDVQASSGPVAVTLASGKDMYPAVTHLADGSAVVTWMSLDLPPGVLWDVTYATVYLQRIGADGQPIGSRVQVGTTTGKQSYPSVTPMQDGGFLVAWSDGRTGRREVWTRSFGADGVPRSLDTKLSTDAGDQDNIRIATLADGRMLATWSSRSSLSPLAIDIRGQFIDAQGNVTGAPFTVNMTGAADKGYQYRPDIAPLADGGFVVTYHASAAGAYQADAYGRRFDRNGVPVGAEFTIAATPKDDWRIAAKGLLDGGYVIVWDTVDASGANRLLARRYDARGVVVGGDFAVGYAVGGTGQSFAQVTPMADGGFVIAWMSYQNGTGTSNADVYAQRFAANGLPVAAPKLIAGGVASQWEPRIAATADNGYTVSWYSNQNGGLDIYAQRFDSPVQQAAVPGSVGGELRMGAYATAPGVSNGEVSAPVLILPTTTATPEPTPAPAPAPEPLPVDASGKTESALNAVRQVTPTGRPGFVLPGASPVFTGKLVVNAVRNAAGEVLGYQVQQDRGVKAAK